MNNIQDLISFINQKLEHVKKDVLSAKYINNNHVAASFAEYHIESLNKIKKILEASNLSSSAKLVLESSLYVTPSDIDGLPQELINELSLGSSEFREFDIIDVMKTLGGIASIDKVLIGIFRKTGDIETRQKMMNRLYRMSVKGLIFSHPTRKGVYSIERIEPEMLGMESEQIREEDEL